MTKHSSFDFLMHAVRLHDKPPVSYQPRGPAVPSAKLRGKKKKRKAETMDGKGKSQM
jgi:hypothetical protein